MEIAKENVVVIYGAGDFGQRLFRFFNKYGVKVDFFCQTKVEDSDRKVCNTDVLSLEEIIQFNGKVDIFLAIDNEELCKQIKLKIANSLKENACIYECGGFIKQNLRRDDFEKYCLICNKVVDKFTPGGEPGEIFEMHDIIGGGPRTAVNCPECHCMDRERWCFYVLSNYTDIFNAECRVLHFAPEFRLMERIKQNEKCDYYSCDITNERAMHIVDVTQIQFKSNTFDYIIINHVLEHVLDESEAISELKRVIKPGGKIIMSFPICTDCITIEDKSIITEEDRRKFYGQGDHVRLYGYDYVDRLEKYGLEISVYSPEDRCASALIERYGFIKNDVCIVATK